MINYPGGEQRGEGGGIDSVGATRGMEGKGFVLIISEVMDGGVEAKKEMEAARIR